MSPSRNNRKIVKSWMIIPVIGIGILWYSFSWVRSFKAATPVVSGDTASLSLASKQSLIKKVIALQSTLDAQQAALTSLATLEKENELLKTEFARNPIHTGVLARVIVPPNRSLYDTVTVDVGHEQGVSIGQEVYGFGTIALGTISDVSDNTATVLLYSASGRQTVGTTTGSDIAVTLIGRGAGEYEVRMPRDIIFEQGGVITEQSIGVHPLATIQKIITDPRDPFQRLLAKAPVNLQTMKWVIVK